MRVGAHRVLGVVVGCLVVAGCASDGADDPVTLPPSTAPATSEPIESSTESTPTPTTTSEPTPSTTLLLPDEHVESVDAFVVEFFAALNAAKDSGDFSAYDAMYLPQCTGCIELRDEVVGWLGDGQMVEGGDWVILQQSSTQFPDGTKGAANVFAYRTRVVTSGSDSETGPAGATSTYWFQVGVLAAEPWSIEDMGRTAIEAS